MSRFFRAKKKLVSMAGGSGAGRKIIKANLGDDGVVILGILKSVTRKLHGKKSASLLKKTLLRIAVKCGYLFKNEILTDEDGAGLKNPLERLCKQFMDATESDGKRATDSDNNDLGGGESKHVDLRSDDEDDDDEEDNEDESHAELLVTAASKEAEGVLQSLSESLRASIETISETLKELDGCLKRMLTPHMKAKNIDKLSHTINVYADPVWLAFFLNNEQCQAERTRSHGVFSNWYDRNFREAAERRAERAAQQHQYLQDRSSFSVNTFLSNPRKQSHLAMYLKEAHGDKSSCQLWQAVENLKSITNRKLVESRARLLYQKFMSEPARKRTHIVLPPEFVSKVEKLFNEGTFTKSMFNDAQAHVIKYLEGEVFAEFLLSDAYRVFVRTAYHVLPDGTPLTEEEEDAEEGGKESRQGGGSKLKK